MKYGGIILALYIVQATCILIFVLCQIAVWWLDRREDDKT